MNTFVFLITVLCSPILAFGCTCINSKGLTDRQYRKQLDSVAAIFEAEVVFVGERIEERRKAGGGLIVDYAYRPVEFKVLSVWKGTNSDRVEAHAEAWSSCAIPAPELGSKLMLYLNRSKGNILQMSYCSVNGFDDARTKRLLGAGKRIYGNKASDSGT